MIHRAIICWHSAEHRWIISLKNREFLFRNFYKIEHLQQVCKIKRAHSESYLDGSVPRGKKLVELWWQCENLLIRPHRHRPLFLCRFIAVLQKRKKIFKTSREICHAAGCCRNHITISNFSGYTIVLPKLSFNNILLSFFIAYSRPYKKWYYLVLLSIILPE